jgi:AcrR family transcriptional regulator
MADFGKRALNKAQTKLNILEAMLELIADTSFRDMKVKDLVEKVKITEMTFFNYFRAKDDLLNFFMGVWALDQAALQLQSPLSGEKAIRRIFKTTAQQTIEHPRVMVILISHLASANLNPSQMELEPAERYLLYPELTELQTIEIKSGNEMLMGHLNEIDPGADNPKILMHLASCFYGDALVAYTSGADISSLYQNSLDLIFEGYKRRP